MPSLAGRPTRDVGVPPAVVGLAAGDALEAVWENSIGGLTFRAATGTSRDRYIKWVPRGSPDIDLDAEAARLRWLDGRVPAPAVIDTGSDGAGAWLVTAAIDAASAVNPRWKADPATAAAAIGRGLRELHDALPVDGCPFSWDVPSRLERARERIERGMRPDGWFPEHQHLTVDAAWAMLSDPPEVDGLVVCHGDACVPNTLLDDDGRFAAHVDLGHLGTGDRWADLAVAAWSTEWNYGPGYDGVVYDAYGVAPEQGRVRYYRLLWDLA